VIFLPFDLQSFLKGAHRVAILGVGSELRADDAAGIEVVRRLRRNFASKNVLLIDAGIAPESFLHKIRRFRPSHILIIDATDFNAKPGSVMLADPDAIVGKSISTHRLPLSILARYLQEQTNASIALLGIQPASAKLGGPMSKRVEEAVEGLVAALTNLLRSV
jgi:hydrogenase 3 maturation protease